MVVRIVAGIGQVLLGLLMVWLSKRFIDVTIRIGSVDDVLRMVMWLVVTVVGGVVLRQVGFWLTTVANVRQMNKLRLYFFSSLFRRQLFEGEELHSGDVTSRLAKDIEQVSTVCTDTLPQMAITAIQLCGAFLLMHWFDARLAWALLLLTPVAIVFGKLIARRLRQMTLDIRNDESRIQMQVQEGMEYNAVLRSLGSEQWVTSRLDSMQQRLHGNVIRRTRFTVVARLIMGCVFGLGYLLAFVWGGIGLRNGTITFGVMTSFLQLVGMIQHPILQLLNLVPGVIHATASIDRLDELGNMTSDAVHDNKCVERNDHQLGKGIRFDNVAFRYANGDKMILENFTYEFKQGSKTAIMGETGIGKTTLFRLILGLVEPTEGVVTVGDDLCFVPQGNTLMSGTIRYNLQLAKPDVTDEALKDVLHTACADFVFDLPEGLDTELGEHGCGLSEGQAQRIAIARGLLRPGTILLLDEVSSSLDEPTEKELYHRLFEAYPRSTMLFITHRPAVTSLCDDVIRL
ncbi:ABC-type multidrug transport system, ATPase and permease component [Prevotella sp. lc2012]|nr:ABC-type multidrug transport system, ATPase and permease component [Prevotella sp. lc2012]